MKEKRLFFILLLVFLIFIFFLIFGGVSLVKRRTSFFGRAAIPIVSNSPSLENSYLFASPLSASAGGQERIRVTIFILDNQGRGVFGVPVFLGEKEELNIIPLQSTTDSLGRAIFEVSSFKAGEYYLEARIKEAILPQRVRIAFR